MPHSLTTCSHGWPKQHWRLAVTNQSEPPDYEKIFQDALEKGGPEIPDFPEANSFEEFAIGQHVMYSFFRKAGFSQGQALYLVAVGISGHPGPPPERTAEQ
jgi:hypothetical protein